MNQSRDVIAGAAAQSRDVIARAAAQSRDVTARAAAQSRDVIARAAARSNLSLQSKLAASSYRPPRNDHSVGEGLDRDTGLARIAAAFAAARAEGRAALMPYCTAGYPNIAASEAILTAIAAAGADLIELGVPFSDPLADGPTIQHSTQVALEQGVTVAGCLELVSRLRRGGVPQPILLMGYANPFLAYGVTRCVAAAAAAGADGFIVPDLPAEEADEFETACREQRLAFVYLLAPTSTPDRIAAVAARGSGFTYLVSLTGVTGERTALPADLAAFVARVRATTTLPLGVGFGIATPEQARAVGRLADGVIVGSALIKATGAAADPAATAASFVTALRGALTP